jgi:hypothetical protein
VGDLSGSHVTLASEQWRMVVSVAAARRVQDVADALSLGEYAVSKALKELVETGVAVIGPVVASTPAKAAKQAEPAPTAKIEPVDEAELNDTELDEPELDEAELADVVAAEADAEAEADEATADGTGKAQPHIEPLTTSPHGPAPLGQEPPATPVKGKRKVDEPEASAEDAAPDANGPDAKKDDTKKDEAVSAAHAKQLVSQLAALSAEAKPKAKAKDEAGSAGGKGNATAKNADDATEAAESGEPDEAAAAEGGDEPLNRGLLLKFLSSVRQ